MKTLIVKLGQLGAGILATSLLVYATPAKAVSLVAGSLSGTITGIQGLDVSGQLYDVSFQNAPFTSIFGSSPLTFNTQQQANQVGGIINSLIGTSQIQYTTSTGTLAKIGNYRIPYASDPTTVYLALSILGTSSWSVYPTLNTELANRYKTYAIFAPSVATPLVQTTSLSLASVEVNSVPEPLTILGTATAIGFGTFFKNKLNRSKSDDKDSKSS